VGAGEAHRGFWWGNLQEGDFLEDIGIDRGIIFNWIFKKQDRGLDCIGLADCRVEWCALVNSALNFPVL
jgi:hypothetical protein